MPDHKPTELARLAQEQAGTYTDGRFITLNSVIEEERAEIRLADTLVYIHHTLRKSVRPSMGASFWRFRARVAGERPLRIRLVRKTIHQSKLPWHRVFWQFPEEALRWEQRGPSKIPSQNWTGHRAVQEALAKTAASQILIKPTPGGTRVEMHIKGEPTSSAILEQQWNAFLLLMEGLLLAD